jgi:hypothetical protein
MIEVETKTIEVKYRRCDIDGCTNRYNESQYNFPRTVRVCCACNKDCCAQHSAYFWDDMDSNYPAATTCTDCAPHFQLAWDEALETAGRYDNLADLALKLLRENRGNPGVPSSSSTS